MNKKIISMLLLAAISFSFIGTGINVQAVEEVNVINNEKFSEHREDEINFNEPTEDEKEWARENIIDDTEELNNKIKSSNYSLARSSDEIFPEVNGRVDISESPWFPEIANQGEQGSCAAFAAVYYQMSYAVNKKYWGDLDEKAVFSPKWIYNLKNGSIDLGSNIYENYQAIQKWGVLSSKSYPYSEKKIDVEDKYESTCTEWALDSKKWKEAQKYSIASDGMHKSDVRDEDNSGYANIELIKSLLREGNVLNVGIYRKLADYIFKGDKRLNPGSNDIDEIMYYCEAKPRDEKNEVINVSSHAVTIVGYDDNVTVDINDDGVIEEAERGAFKIANSWGKNQPNDGFIWVAYDALNDISKVEENENSKSKDYKLKRGKFFSGYDLNWITDPTYNDEGVKLYAEFKLNTNARGNFSVSVEAKRNRRSHECKLEFFDDCELSYSSIKEGYKENRDISFKGTAEACDGSFVVDLSKVVKGISLEELQEYTWSLVINNVTGEDRELRIKDFRIVDEVNKLTYSTSEQLPELVNKENNDVSVEIDFNNVGTYIEEKTKSGWIEEDGLKYYYIDGEKKTGWQSIDGDWFFFDESTGEMKTGWLERGDRWYFLNDNGVMQTGWLERGGRKYYLNPVTNEELPKGAMETNWAKIDGKWYYFNPESDGYKGAMKTGWVSYKNNWYYLSTEKTEKYPEGAMQTEWVKDGEHWYYLNPVETSKLPEGAMQRGWVKVGGYWYYLNPTKTDSLPGGAMKTGWLYEGGKTYYLNEKSDGYKGAMQTGWTLVNDKWYNFDASGALIQ